MEKRLQVYETPDVTVTFDPMAWRHHSEQLGEQEES